jgi:probable rRNA maturation factor
MHKVIISREKRGLGFNDADKLITKAVKAALKSEGVDEDCIVNVMLTDDEGIHEINLEQRNVDAPTDVLSFPLNELTPGQFDADICEYDYENECVMLGDMVISLQRCQEQSRQFGHSFQREVSYLTVHSVLHLLGYDHMDEGEEKKLMRSREDAVMETLKL